MNSRWIVRFVENPTARLRLFCFPQAGGAAWIYRPWAVALSDEIEVCAVELPGHGNRIRETPFRDFADLLDRLVQVLFDQIDRPIALFGHSLGAVLAFEVVRRIHGRANVQVKHLFVSGHNAPQTDNDLEDVSTLDDRELIERLRQLNCTPEGALQNVELMQLMLPVIRADFALYRSYVYQDVGALECPLTALGGLRDPRTDLIGLQAWQMQTSNRFSLRQFAGDHFFVSSAREALLRLVAGELG